MIVDVADAISARVRREVRAWRRSRIVTERQAFWRRERARMPGTHGYRLRTGEHRAVLLRHDTLDTFVLEECFGARMSYRFPPPISAALDRERTPRIVDVGANVGLFGLLALNRWPECTVVGFEADPENARLHEACIATNDLGSRWRLVRGFASNEAGVVRFRAGRSAMARAASADEEAIEIQAIDLFEGLGRVDLLKIDIEGAEWPLLSDPRLAQSAIGAIVVECHGRGCPGGDPLATGRELLVGAGFEPVAVDPDPLGLPLAGRGVIWAGRAQALADP